MSAVATPTEITPEDLLAMPEGKDFELVDGRLVERSMSALSSWVGGEILFRIRLFLKDNPVGLVWGADNGFQCFPDDPNKVRKPDVSFLRRERIPSDLMQQGYVRVAPDLAVEVISPNENAEELHEKVSDYLNAAVALIWVVYPESRVISVQRADKTGSRLTIDDELSGESILPGFALRLETLFESITSPAVVRPQP
jgi:Uma2 family endonuclease